MFVVFVGFFRVVFVQIFVSVFVAEVQLFRLRVGHFGDVKRRDFIAFLAFHNVAFVSGRDRTERESAGKPAPRAVGVRVGENVRGTESEQITGKDNLSSVLRQERKAKNAPSATTSRLRSAQKTRNRRRVRFYFTRFAVFGKRRKTKFPQNFPRRPLRRSARRAAT